MTAAELDDWLAYAEVEPFGPLEDSRRAGVVAWAALTLSAGKGAPRPEELFPELRGPQPRRTDEQTVMLFRAWAVACGGEVIEPDVVVEVGPGGKAPCASSG